MAVIDAIQNENVSVMSRQFRKKRSGYPYLSLLISIVISFIGWIFESQTISNSLNLSNLISLIIFLPIYVYGDKYSNLVQRPNLHSKDMTILLDENSQHINQIEKNRVVSPIRDVDLIKRRQKEFILQHFSRLQEQYSQLTNYVVIRDGFITLIEANNIVDGDILFLRENQRIPCDCQVLPNFSSQQSNNLSTNSEIQKAISYGIGQQVALKTEFDQSVFDQLLVNVHKQQTNQFPLVRIVQSELSKPENNEQDYLISKNKQLFDDYLFLGYTINKIENKQSLTEFNFNLQQLAQSFAQQNNLQTEQVIQQDFIDIAFKVLQQLDSVCVSNQTQALVGLKLCSGVFAVVINTKARCFLYKSLFAKLNNFEIDSRRTLFQKKATIPSTFFTHLNGLQLTIKKLPFTIIASLLIIVAPHFIRLCILPNYSTLLGETFTGGDTFLKGFIPSFCAALTFGMSSLVFINKASTLFKPLLKSATKYASILKERQVLIPTLGSLESLGFTNTLVIEMDHFVNPKKQLELVNIGTKSIRGQSKIFDRVMIKQYENIFSHKVLRPFYIVHTESETSTWLSFVRLVSGLSLQNEEIYYILKNSHNIRNIYCNDYFQTEQPQINEESSEMQKPKKQNQETQQAPRQKITEFLKPKYPFFQTLPLHEFQKEQFCDFSSLIQARCLQDANCCVQQLHPLSTYPNLGFIASIPTSQNQVFIVRGQNYEHIINYCSKIVSHSIHDVQIGIISDITSDQDTQAYEYEQFTGFGEQCKIFQRKIFQADLEYLEQQQKNMIQNCSDICHYAIAFGTKQQSFSEMVQQKKFVYTFSIGFSSQVNKCADFIKRFQQNQIGMNLILTTHKTYFQSQSVLKKLNLHKFSRKAEVKKVETESFLDNSESEVPQKKQLLTKAPILKSKMIKDIEQKSKQTCINLKSQPKSYESLTNYILTKSLTNKKHLIKLKNKKPEKAILMKPFLKPQPTKEEKLNLVASQDEYYQVNSEDETIIYPVQKVHKKHRNRYKHKVDTEDSIQLPGQKLIMKPETKKMPLSLFVITETTPLNAACNLSNQGLFVSLVTSENQFQTPLNDLIDLNQNQPKHQNPDFMVVNYQQETNSKVSEHVIRSALQTGLRVSTCSIKGKYALNRLLDVCQEIPFYLMTLSPVFLGTIRSRLMVGLLPLYLLVSVILIEIWQCVANFANFQEVLQIRPFFYPPISAGTILLFSAFYIEFILPLIIWTPPKHQIDVKDAKAPCYKGNRAAMLWDFNKLLPKKTSNKALVSLGFAFFFCCLVIVFPSGQFYFESYTETFLDDFISTQQLKLSPFISIYYCMFFTAFTTGALLVANKLPLGQVWGLKVPLKLKMQKLMLFVLIQIISLCVIFILPTIDGNLGKILLGFDKKWSTDNFVIYISISFGIAIVISVIFILEQVLFVRTG